jgi:DNA-binding FadR family transcriptional regulator
MVISTVHSRLLETLGMEITSGLYAAGTVLRLEDLEHRFTLSRTAVREVIRVLESMHLVESRQRIGITIQDAAQWNVFDPRIIRWRLDGDRRMEQLCSLTELRQAIEPMAAREAAENATKAQRFELLRLGAQLMESGSAGDLIRYLEYDIAFHQLILAASGNEMFAALAEPIAEVLRGRTLHHLMPSRPVAESLQWHGQVAEAISAKDAAAAEAAMRAITSEVGNVWKQVSSVKPRSSRRVAGEGATEPDRTPEP